jgi:microtubule-associated protein-like 6
MFYFRLNGTAIENPDLVKDAWWATWSLPVGWPVQGIWPTDVGCNEYIINAVARPHTWESVPVLATADDYGRVKIFNYPCVEQGAPDKCYKGHSEHVTNIKFSHDDAYCVTTGGGDKCIFVWGTDIIEEKRERDALFANGNVPSSVVLDDIEGVHNFLPFKQMPTGGDEFTAIKPWKGAIRPPSDWEEQSDLGQPPDACLELKFVYGYRGSDCRNNISYADNVQKIIYHVAGCGIVLNTETQSQMINTEHDDDILCLAIHPEGHTVATGIYIYVYIYIYI